MHNKKYLQYADSAIIKWLYDTWPNDYDIDHLIIRELKYSFCDYQKFIKEFKEDPALYCNDTIYIETKELILDYYNTLLESEGYTYIYKTFQKAIIIYADVYLNDAPSFNCADVIIYDILKDYIILFIDTILSIDYINTKNNDILLTFTLTPGHDDIKLHKKNILIYAESIKDDK